MQNLLQISSSAGSVRFLPPGAIDTKAEPNGDLRCVARTEKIGKASSQSN